MDFYELVPTKSLSAAHFLMWVLALLSTAWESMTASFITKFQNLNEKLFSVNLTAF